MMKTITVDAAALRQVLEALVGPGVVLRELQGTRRVAGDRHPINILIREFEEEYITWTELETSR